MWKNAALVASFLILTPIALGTSMFALLTVSDSNVDRQVLAAETSLIQPQIYASLPSVLPSVSSEVGIGDARVEIIRQYLDKYNSPMLPYAKYLVDMADAYDTDFRLLTAIGQQESNLCKKIPEDSFNCWGWGIHSAGTLGFRSFEEGIETVSRGLKTNYIDEGYVTVDEIMDKWVPHSPERAWAKSVTNFMDEML